MAILAKSKLFNSPKFDSSVKSANTTGWEKWLGYFFGPMGPAILNVTIISYITVFYTDVLNMTGEGHSALWLGIFAAFPIVSKIIDAITNILMGQVIEKTRTRQGKARPWIFISAPLLSTRVQFSRPVIRSTSIRSTPTIVTSCTGKSLCTRWSTARCASS